MDEIEKLLEENPEASSGYALTEMHYGRLEWLAEHIRRCNYQISPMVAQKILAMLEGTDQSCFFELKAVRRTGLAPSIKDPVLQDHRDFDLAVRVARLGGYQRAHRQSVCKKVADETGVGFEYVMKVTRRFKSQALDVVKEEQAEEAYRLSNLDKLNV